MESTYNGRAVFQNLYYPVNVCRKESNCWTLVLHVVVLECAHALGIPAVYNLLYHLHYRHVLRAEISECRSISPSLMSGGAIQFASYCKIMSFERAPTLCIILKFEMKVDGHSYWTEAKFFLNMLIKYYQNRSLLYSLRFSCLCTSVSCLSLTVALHHLCTDLKFFH